MNYEILNFGFSGNGRGQKEVAEILGISQSYISRIEKKVIKGLQRVMEIS